ncbi:MAG TPA: hypothetical protein VFG33_10730 [Kribbella sp.]|uniref:hypothetical protein n=1 Tax=Kribbella sp. TaxID=1871183 RepID=UPI002D783A00|nr:hypothetical protein [Kribbella sp.]HET6293845.1 hypothetical protein [Kribbella sp.]
MENWVPLVGVVVAQFVLLGLYVAKQKADDRRRWHEKRLDAYRALSKSARQASSIYAGATESEDLDDRRFVLAMNEADACMLDIDLLSSPSTREAAVAVATVLEMCVVFDPEDAAFPTAEHLLSVRFDFERAVRTELGIPKEPRRLSREDRQLLAAIESANKSDETD